MVGLTAPTSGSATIEGIRFADLPNPGLDVLTTDVRYGVPVGR
jgi:hypothetical protein